MRRRQPAPRRHDAGFGLVELMVSLALGLVVVGGAAMIFVGTRYASSSTDSLSRMQETVRTSYDLMVREVREAGGTPCDAQILVGDVLANGQGAAPTWWAVWTDPLRGFDGADVFDGAAFGTGVAQRVAGTAALLVRYAPAIDNLAVATHVTGTATFTANRVNPGINAGDLLMVCNYKQGAIFQVSAANAAAGTFTHLDSAGAPGNCSKGLGLPTLCTPTGNAYQFTPGSLIGNYIAVGWYVGNNSHPETGGRSLYRVTRQGAQEVAEGVRDLQLRYLVSGGTDYVAAAAVADWSQVRAVRFDITFEAPDTGTSTKAAGTRLTRSAGFTVNLRDLQP